MVAVRADAPERFRSLLDRLSERSVNDYYNPYTSFDWPASLPDDDFWMSPELLTVAGTAVEHELDRAQLVALSRWESVNFYSLNVHGIRELLIEVVDRIHTPGFEAPSDFFHHFVGEENEHMWFFAEFCRRYGGKLYPATRIATSDSDDAELTSFLVFARILLFEEVVDFYNVHMARDERLDPTIRQINRIHHHDESRHIAFGRELVAWLHARLRERGDGALLAEAETYLKRYLVFSIRSFYSPEAYRDAGLAEPLRVRERVLADPARERFHAHLLRKPLGFMTRTGIFGSRELPAL